MSRMIRIESLTPIHTGVAQALASNTTLETLTIGDGQFGDESLKMLIPGLASSSSLRQLQMGGVPLSCHVAAQLGTALLQGQAS